MPSPIWSAWLAVCPANGSGENPNKRDRRTQELVMISMITNRGAPGVIQAGLPEKKGDQRASADAYMSRRRAIGR